MHLGFGGSGADFVILAVGASWRPNPAISDTTGIKVAQQAWNLASAPASLTTLGVTVGGNIAVPGFSWEIGGPTHYPSNFGGTHLMRDVPAYVRLIERGQYDAKSLATATYPLDKVPEAYEAVIERTTVAAVLTFV